MQHATHPNARLNPRARASSSRAPCKASGALSSVPIVEAHRLRGHERRSAAGGAPAAPRASRGPARPGRGPVQRLRPLGDRQAGALGQGLQPPQPARFHRRAVAALGVQQDHLGRAGGLGEVVGRQADAPLRRGQAQRLAHRPRQEGVGRGGGRPDALLQTGHDQPVGADQSRLDRAQDAKARMGRSAVADRLAVHQPLQQVGELARPLRTGGSVAVGDQRR